MDIFTQKKWLIRSLVFLAILNISSISFVFWNRISETRDNRHRKDKEVNVIADLLKKELNLTETQTHQLEKIRADFFEKEEVLAQEIREKRDSMNMIMFNQDTNDTLIQLLAKSVADGEYQMELLRFQQAQSLKEICTMEQKKKFQYLVIEIRDYFRPEKRK